MAQSRHGDKASLSLGHGNLVICKDESKETCQSKAAERGVSGLMLCPVVVAFLFTKILRGMMGASCSGKHGFQCFRSHEQDKLESYRSNKHNIAL